MYAHLERCAFNSTELSHLRSCSPLLVFLSPRAAHGQAASPSGAKPEDTEVWEPVPKVVTPGATCGAPPSDAVVLFDGKSMDEWVSVKDKSPAQWTVADGVMTVSKGQGSIETKRSFKNYQLHVEWKVPTNITGTGQGRGNSGVFLASTGPGDSGYELQVLDSYENKTYVNGMAGSIYKQAIPLANPTRKPGEWQMYDIAWTAPTFNSDGTVKTPAYVTVLFNGVLVENHYELKGETFYIGKPAYKQYTSAPSSCRRTATRASPSAFAISGFENSNKRSPLGQRGILRRMGKRC